MLLDEETSTNWKTVYSPFYELVCKCLNFEQHSKQGWYEYPHWQRWLLKCLHVVD